MPEISLFYGIRITMFYSDHNPPHFHAEYAGNKALIDIQSACVIRGALPFRQLKLIHKLSNTAITCAGLVSLEDIPYLPPTITGAFSFP